jgi:hypothetical protein
MSSDRIHHRFLRASSEFRPSSHSSSDPHTHYFPSHRHPTLSAPPELPCSIDSRSEVALCQYPLHQWSQKLFQHGTMSVLARILSMLSVRIALGVGSHMSSRFSHLSALSLNQAAQPHTSHTTCHSSPSIPCILHCQVVLLVAESSDVFKLSSSPHSNHHSLSRSSL